MNERLEELKRRITSGELKSLRRSLDLQANTEGMSWCRAKAAILQSFCEAECPVILPGEKIVFTRTISENPPTPVPENIRNQCKAEGTKIAEEEMGNICADWEMSLEQGLLGRKEAALQAKKKYASDPEAVDFLDAAVLSLDAVMGLVKKYRDVARAAGREDVARMLERVPGRKPESFHQALQSLRFQQAAVWLSGTKHVGLGRLDQYLWPYLQKDLDSGLLTTGDAEELLAEFFISLNKDADLYPGVQLGDNGQSVMLGGIQRDGSDAVNPLTWMCLRVSRQVHMIDPKLNLRVSSKTDSDLLVEAAKLTREGLGFPQYANDEVIIPALASHGYSLEDARDYIVAACWEFIIPGKGMDIPNINALSFPHAADKAIREGLLAADSFEQILERSKAAIREQVELYVCKAEETKHWNPNPFYSSLMTECIEKGKDLNHGGAKYLNYGVHGAGSANAADALAAVKTVVFDRKEIDGKTLVRALEANFEGFEPIRNKLRETCPKTCNGEELPDSLLARLFQDFAGACEAVSDNGRGGRIRPGTGSAMYYVWLATGKEGMLEPVVGATGDGRKKGEYLACSLAPSPGAPVSGPFSILQTFSRIDYSRVYNGGPITLEFSDTLFRNDEALGKVADFIRLFVKTGCQQLQINTINPEILRDARIHPECHKNLIVRVWGWSGYFCELSPEYQEQIISRVAL